MNQEKKLNSLARISREATYFSTRFNVYHHGQTGTNINT
jgi:hypothetical protein